jgi:metallophosphoesterase superfamily enzyme
MLVLREWLLTALRVAVHLPTRTAVVADLHLGYAEARRRRGEAVPRECIFDILKPLEQVRQQHAARRLVVAGDLLEDDDCGEALETFWVWLDQREIELIAVVPGNHDLGLSQSMAAASRLPLSPEGIMLGDWCIVHGEGRLPEAPVVHGHEHPCLRWSPKSRAIRPRTNLGRIARFAIDAPCYLSGPDRLILPAFSKEAAGVNVLSLRRWGALRCQVVADDRVLDFGEVATLRRRLRRSPSVD